MKKEEPTELTDQIRRFTADRLGVHLDRVVPSASLFHNLGVDGADGIEFMEAYGEHFRVDLSEFVPAKHFGPEAGFNLFYYLAEVALRLVGRRLREPFVTITVADLVHAAEIGKWTEK